MHKENFYRRLRGALDIDLYTQAIDSSPVKANARMHPLELKAPEEGLEPHLSSVPWTGKASTARAGGQI
ncbi:MAG: hypothetical protein NXH90_06835 [Flavobacteriaceae bacterium]|nr:hypothetical protein [Flavobacteriaceae bacterium]